MSVGSLMGEAVMVGSCPCLEMFSVYDRVSYDVCVQSACESWVSSCQWGESIDGVSTRILMEDHCSIRVGASLETGGLDEQS